MSTLVQSLIALALIWVFAYRRARMSTILVSVLVLLLAMTFYAGFAWLPWLLLLLVDFFYIATDLRMQLMTQPLYKFFRSVLPPMSSNKLHWTMSPLSHDARVVTEQALRVQHREKKGPEGLRRPDRQPPDANVAGATSPDDRDTPPPDTDAPTTGSSSKGTPCMS